MSQWSHRALTLRLAMPLLAGPVLVLSILLAAGWTWIDREAARLDARREAAMQRIARLPSSATLPVANTRATSQAVRLERVFALLAQQGWSSRQVRYRYADDGSLSMDLAFSASYPALRETMTLLKVQAGASVSRLTLTRKSMQDATLAVVMQLTLTKDK